MPYWRWSALLLVAALGLLGITALLSEGFADTVSETAPAPAAPGEGQAATSEDESALVQELAPSPEADSGDDQASTDQGETDAQQGSGDTQAPASGAIAAPGVRLSVDDQPIEGDVNLDDADLSGLIPCAVSGSGVERPYDPDQAHVGGARPAQIVVTRSFGTTSVRLLQAVASGGQASGRLFFLREADGPAQPYLTIEFTGFLTGVSHRNMPLTAPGAGPGLNGPLSETLTLTCGQVIWRDHETNAQAEVAL